MSATIQSSKTAWTGDAKKPVHAPGSQRWIGLLLITASAAVTICSLWALGRLVGRLLGL